MGNVVSFQERAIKRLQQDQSIQVMLYGAAREDALFVSSVSPDHAAIKILKQSSTYKFMSAVAANSLHKVWVQENIEPPKDFNKRGYFAFPEEPQRARFVTSAHLCRSYEIAMKLGTKNKVDFRIPDSEGHLPLYFIARYALDKDVIPYLCRQFNINARDSGRPCGIGLSPFDAPLFRAIKYSNIHALQGLASPYLHGGALDLDKTNELKLTPLIYAVLLAEEGVQQLQNGEISQTALNRKLWVVRFLASKPEINPAKIDPDGWSADDFARNPKVREALHQGFTNRMQTLIQMQIY